MNETNTEDVGMVIDLPFLFIFLTLFVGVLVRMMMLFFNIPVSFKVLLLIFGGLIGFLASYYPNFKPFVRMCYAEVETLLTIFLPIIMFQVSYNIDFHSFWKSFPQIILISIPGVLLSALFISFVAYYVIEPRWSYATAFLFGMICTPVYPAEMVDMFKGLSKGKHLSVLLLGESLIGYAFIMMICIVLFAYLGSAITTGPQFCFFILRYTGGGLMLGTVLGYVSSAMLSFVYYDIICTASLTLVSAYFTYYIAEHFFYVSGLLATVICGVIISDRRTVIRSEIEHLLSQFWYILSYTTNTLVFTMVGVAVGDKVSPVITVRQVSLVLVTYLTVYMSRFLVFCILMPVLRKTGYGLTWNQSMALVWGGLKGSLVLFLALMVLQNGSFGDVFVIQTTGLVLLSFILNGSTMSKILKIFGLAELSLAKKANMTNCVKKVMMSRDRCISMLKMDKFLADANWELVLEGTTIKHPYQLQISGKDDDSDDDTYMGYRYTTCPDCDREIPNEPTKKEFAEMMREANQRVLKALKISYWKQYEHGKISKDGLRVLIQAVEVASDSANFKINIDTLGSLWKPKAYAVWLRRKLVQMLTPETASTNQPTDPCRRKCYMIVSTQYFEWFIYFVILCNTPVILCEVILRPGLLKSHWIKSLNLLFYLIYLWEMVMKMIGFGFLGYFKSNWNKLDFFIIVMATLDLILDIVDLSTIHWDKAKSNSILLSVTKLLRTLRFLRLFKLARASVPKIMAYMDRMIDVHLAFGYDVGKGFVTGEQEVCSLLPQLIDNKQIQETLYSRLEIDRLIVTKQLGLLQRDRPWTAITVKTRQASTSTLNIMILEAMKLKEEGFLDEVEFRLLVNAIEERLQFCSRKVGYLVPPASPETQLRAVSWLQGNERLADYFIEHSELLNFINEEILLTRGDKPKGLYILVSGLLEASYVPPETNVEEAIPNLEFLTDLQFAEPSQDYIVSGNAVGVLGILTERPYNCTVKCESAVQAYYITMNVMKEAFNLAPHPILGLEAAMWREIGIKLALMILPSVPAYHGWPAEKLNMKLEHSFVPCLKAFKTFVVNELMEDLLLIDGVCQDMVTREVFLPPCYIHRTVHRLVFPKSSQMNVSSHCPETKLLIIPAKETDELDIMDDVIDDNQCELISNVSSRCLYHKVSRRLSNESKGARRRPNKRRRQGGPKRVNYRDSVWSKTSALTGQEPPSERKENKSGYYSQSFSQNDIFPEKLSPQKSSIRFEMEKKSNMANESETEVPNKESVRTRHCTTARRATAASGTRALPGVARHATPGTAPSTSNCPDISSEGEIGNTLFTKIEDSKNK